MKGKGRNKDQALLRTVASKDAQTFATKRLIKDLEQIDNEKVPTVGVTARPLEHDLFLWHANIRGPEGTPYEGGVFHLELQIPASYPHHPPAVKLFTTIPHPNVFGNYICLDMLQINRKEGQGWSSAYSIQSVLMQLQSFLFEEDLNQEKNQQLMNIKKAVKQANEFKCSERNCKHGGKLSCWPPFSTHEQVAEDFLTLEEENDLINKEIICYHTKLHFTKNPAGPRTQDIEAAQDRRHPRGRSHVRLHLDQGLLEGVNKLVSQ
jgi:ubiquitin-protein ligase